MNQLTQEQSLENFAFSQVQVREIHEPVEIDRGGFDQDILFESVPLDSYNLSYTCLLIPRFPSHQIKGDLADMLPQRMQQICISYGWNLEFTSAQAEYFQWGVSVPPSTSPSLLMQKTRLETSSQIMADFGWIKRENLSGDFWAPGYLVVLGTRPHPEEMIHQFIRLTRSKQGLSSLY